jgi:hypothetical protein
VDLLTGNAFGIVGGQKGGAGDIAALLADRLRAAEDDVVDQRVSKSLRDARARSGTAASSTAVTSCNEPSGLPFPRGVRT